ncbi:MAG: hypothetical protein U0795_17545 [Pirellulales bacterium]
MFIWSSKKATVSARGANHQRRQRGRRFRLENLEDRRVLAAFSVTNLDDAGSGSLRAAIEQANANPDSDVINFSPGLQGTITLQSQLHITNDLAINGPGQQQLTISGNDATRVFRVDGSTTDVELNHLTIADGFATDVVDGGAFGTTTGGGGILNLGGNLTLSYVTVANNVSDTQASFIGQPGKPAQSYGGGIFNRGNAHLTATHTTFSGNLATAAVGTSFQFHGGGAIFNDANSTAEIHHSLFTGNRTTDAGGAIYNSDGSQMFISDTTFVDNEALFAGGAIESAPVGLSSGTSAKLTIEHSSFIDNRAIGDLFAGSNGSGGAIRSGGGSLIVDQSRFVGNEARGGDSSTGNGGIGRGGAIYLPRLGFAYQATISHSRFLDNLAVGGTGGAGKNGGDGRGGAVMAFGAGKLDIVDSLFNGNEAHGGQGGTGGNGGNALGGAIYNDVLSGTAGSVSVAGSHVVNNRAIGGAGGQNGGGGVARGGGIYNGAAVGAAVPTVSLLRTNVNANRATGGAGVTQGSGQGGGIYNSVGGTFNVDSLSPIRGNKASAKDLTDDVFGSLSIL